MTGYDTLSQAMASLRDKGYTEDFKLDGSCLVGDEKEWGAKQFEIDEYHRFEGMSDPGDSSILYAISCGGGHKGLLVNAYGVYSDEIADEIVEKLKEAEGH